MEIDGTVNAAGRLIEFDNSTSVTFNGSVICDELRPGRGWGSKGIVYFKNTVNAIRRIRQDATDIYPMVAGALDGTEFYLTQRWWGDSKSGIKLGGFSQTIPCLDANLENPAIDAYANDAGGNLRSSSEATLTITGGVTYVGNDTAYCRYYIGYGSEKINLVLDAPNFTQVFMERGGSGSYPNNTTGQIGISNGTFRVTDKVQFPNVPTITVAENGILSSAITNGVTFGACATLRLDGKLVVDDETLLPFAQDAVALELGPNAEVWLPEGMAFRLASLKINGVVQGPGIYNTGAVKRGTLVLAGGAATWTGGGGADTSVSTAANWGGTLPDIYFGSAALRFASGGASAAVGSACLFGTTTLSAANGFAFTKSGEDAAIGISGKILIEKGATETNTVRAFTFAPPVTLTASTANLAQTLTVPENDTLAFNGGYTQLGSTATLVKDGAGALELGDGSVLERWLTHNEGELRIRGLLATPGHVDQGDAYSSYWGGYSISMDATTGKNQSLVLDGATIEKPFFGKRSTRLFTTVSNTVNVFKGAVCMYDPATELPANGPDGELWFRGGLNCSWSFTASGGGTVHICDYVTDALSRTNDIRNVNVGDGTRLVFEGVKTRLWEGLYFSYANAIAVFRQSYATVEPINMLYFGNQYGTGVASNTVDLCSTTQRVVKIRHNNAGRTRTEVITGASGSALEITGGADDESTNVVAWAGGVSLLKTGASKMTMRYRENSSTGDIVVSGGELVFTDDSSWRNGTNVTVAGTGKLTVTQPDTFGREIALTLNDNGILSMAEGVRVRTASLTVDGAVIGPGRYTYANAPAALKAHLDPAAGGAVSVKGGIVLLFK